jgi:predicted Rossmann-fold nucleotide-binding protein
VIAIGGGYGTLSEISFALKNGIPVIGLNTWSFSRDNVPDNSIILIEDPVEAAKLAVELAV